MERAGFAAAALTAAYLLDLIIGDPPRFPHPVRLLGAVITGLERVARRVFISPAGLKAAGAAVVLIAAGGAAALTACLLALVYRAGPAAGLILEIYIIFAVLAGGDLHRHLRRVEYSLQSGNLEEARAGVSFLVSRDTTRLDEGGVSRSALESLFENSADGLVAPLFFAAVGGPAAAVFYKAVNTLDSMLGYKTEDYIHLGFFAARLDDLLSCIPSRLTALLIIIAGAGGGRFKRGLHSLIKDRRSHESPNSAWPEAAAAGILNVRLGGSDYYHDMRVERPVINSSGREAESGDIRRGLGLFFKMSLLAFVVLVTLAWFLRAREVVPF